MRRGYTIPAVAAAMFLLSLPAIGQEAGSRFMEKTYLDRSASIGEEDLKTRLELSMWCREHGFIREMLNEVDIILKGDPQNLAARGLLYQKAKGEGWAYALPEPAVSKKPALDSGKLSNLHKKMLNTARTREFKMAVKSVRFSFWTDLDRKRIEDYATLLNPYYNSLTGFFQVTKGERGIDVAIYSKKSDFLDFYNRNTGKSGEHLGGFYSYNEGDSLLCFFDDPNDDARVFDVAKHECTHLLVRQCLEGARMANWLNEGLACFFAGDGEELLGPYASGYLMTVRHMIDTGTAPTLKELIEIPYANFAYKHYAMAWSWIYYLRSNPDTRDKLKKLLTRLRKEARTREDDDLAGMTNSLFHQVVGSPARLQMGWNRFVEKELVPKNEEQYYYCAQWCLRMAGGYGRLDPPLQDREKPELLRKGEEWVGTASAKDDDVFKGKCALEKIFAMLARARCMGYDVRETTYAAAEAARLVDAFMSNTKFDGSNTKFDGSNTEFDGWNTKFDALACDAAYEAYRAMIVLWRAGEFKNPEGSLTCDFPERFDHRCSTLESELKRSGSNASRKERITRDLEFLSFQKKIVQNLIAESRYGNSFALAGDPAHRRAKLRWLRMTLDFNVKDLESVFPHVLFQSELDPDDVNLAALAAAYAAAGKRPYARSLLDKAYSITPDEESLEDLAYYVVGSDR